MGATLEAEGVRFVVWAPRSTAVDVVLEDEGSVIAMRETGDGFFEAFVSGLRAGTRYKLRMNGQGPMPDPASRFQPEGVHGPSEVIDPASFRFQEATWRGHQRSELVFYELHLGTFTPEGTYRAAIGKLPYLKQLGITAIELMPIAEFPGRWNWGYDPAAFLAPSRAYGRPEDLVALVDAAHAHGLSIFLDVVYNHFGPDGAYAVAFAPDVFTEDHHTPWGPAINLDGARSRPVRSFLLESARTWLEDYRFDGLRLDAVFALVDDSPKHFLTELSEVTELLPGPKRHLIAEDHRNLRTVIEPRSAGGNGLDGVWADDFHHSVRRIVAGDHESYYADFEDRTADVARCLKQGWLFTGQHSRFQGHARGTPTDGLTLEQFVICIQNHDQVGNRPEGDRLHHKIGLPEYRAVSSLLLFAPELPLLFMGQEWAVRAPFQYFTDHEPELGKLVSKGRKEEFGSFSGFGSEVPDPQDPKTMERSRLDWSEQELPEHRGVLALYRDLLALRPKLGGAWRVTSPVEGAVLAERGPLMLLVALKPGIEVPIPPGLRAVWSSEAPDYTADPMLPQVHEAAVSFHRPAALRLERVTG